MWRHDVNLFIFQKANKDEKKTESKETKSGETAEKSGSEPQDFTSVRDRHSSGESIDSSMSMSPYDTILLEQQHIKHLEQLQAHRIIHLFAQINLFLYTKTKKNSVKLEV